MQSLTCLNGTCHITLIHHSGDDLTVVNAARASFNKRSDGLTERDAQLIEYLAKNKHMSPFRHIFFTFCITNIPEFILRQFFRHQVGCGYTSDEVRFVDIAWNETSGRYVNLESNFYLPPVLRKQHESNKQASIADSVVEGNDECISKMHECMVNCFRVYHDLLKAGVCREQARIVLPLSFQSSVTVSMSLEATVNFIKLRKHSHAQVEMQEVADCVYSLVAQVAPVSLHHLLNNY